MRIHFIARTIAVAICLRAGFSQHVELRAVPSLQFPSEVDSNSPAIRGSNELIIFNSTGLGPVRSTGVNQTRLRNSLPVSAIGATHRPYWIESTWVDQDGTVFAWYHHE